MIRKYAYKVVRGS